MFIKTTSNKSIDPRAYTLRVPAVAHYRRYAEEMKCPADLRKAFHKILYWTLIEIRAYCNDEKYSLALSDHAHNIPNLIENYTVRDFFYYWECERLCFLEELEKIERKPQLMLEKQWEIVREAYERIKAQNQPFADKVANGPH